MKKILLFLFPMLCFFTFQAQSQDYSSAVGLRAGYGATVSYKHFVGTESAFEALGGFGFNSVYAALLYEKHNQFTNDVRGLTWYWGAGASVLLSDGGSGVGILGAIGLDYAFADIPLNLSLDWMPNIFIGGGYGFKGAGGGLAIRYILNR